jgi:hypothetical protein
MSTIDVAFREATRTDFRQIAQELQEALGQRLVAFATGVRSPQAVGRWATGKSEPQGEAGQRLRNLYRVFVTLRETENHQTMRAWIQGANPQLANQAPIELLREDPGAVSAVTDAASTFVDV